MEEPSSASQDRSPFPQTQWPIILAAGSQNPQQAQAALDKLCSLYRKPIVNWFLRNNRYGADSEDLTHDFVIYLLGKSLLLKVTPPSGPPAESGGVNLERTSPAATQQKPTFRSFLRACLKNFLRDHWDRVNAQKRGGQAIIVPLDEALVSENESETFGHLDVDLALAIHGRVMKKLASPVELVKYIFRKDENIHWQDVAAQLDVKAPALRQAIRRLRLKHWKIFNDEVAELVSQENNSEETQYLYELLFKNPPIDAQS